jgi:PAS domain S-box-containing protein
MLETSAMMTALNSVADGILVLRPIAVGNDDIWDFSIDYANEAAGMITGFGVERLRVATVKECLPEIVENGLFESCTRVLLSGETLCREVFWHAPEGDKCLIVQVQPSGRSGLVLILSDATMLKRTSAAQARLTRELAFAQTRFRDFARCASDWFWEADVHGRLTSIVNANDTLHAAPIAPLNGQLISECFVKGKEDDDLLRALVARQQPFKNLHCHLVVNGGIRVLRVSGVPNVEPTVGFIGYRGTALDVTEHREKAEALAKAQRIERLLRAAIESSPVNVTISDATKPDRPLMFVNAAFCRTTGYSVEEVIGQNCRFLQGADTDPDTVRTISQALREQREISVQILNYRKDGQPFWNQLAIAPVHADDGALIAFVGVQHDCSEQVDRARQEIKRQRLEALGQLAGGIAHEINNHLQPALAFPELIADILPTESEQEREWLATISEHARHARTIVRDILRFSRAEPAATVTCEIVEVVREALDFVRNMLPGSIEVRRGGALATLGSIGWCKLCPTGLRQVLANLLGNAAHAMQGVGVVRVDLTMTASEHGERYACLVVRDSGCGMDETTRNRIFEPFFTTKAVGQGTGLGLSVVYGIIEQWGGRIEVESEVGEGTEFRILLPLESAQVATPARSAA